VSVRSPLSLLLSRWCLTWPSQIMTSIASQERDQSWMQMVPDDHNNPMSDSASASTLVDDDVPDMMTCDDNDILAFPCVSTDPEFYPAPFEDTSTICSTDTDLMIGPRSRTDRLLPKLPPADDVTSFLSSPLPLSPSNNLHTFWEFPLPFRKRKQSVSVSSIQSQGSYSNQPLFGFVSERKLSGLRRPPLLSSTASGSSTSTTDSLQTKVGVDVDVRIPVPEKTKTAVPLKTRSSLKSKNSPGKRKQCCVKFVETPIVYYEEAYEHNACEVDEEDFIKPIPPPKPKPSTPTDTQKASPHMGLTKLKSLVKGSLKKRSGERDRHEPQNLGRDRQAVPVIRPEVDAEPVNDSARPRISGPYPMSVAARQRRAALSEGKVAASTGGNGFRSFWGRLSHSD